LKGNKKSAPKTNIPPKTCEGCFRWAQWDGKCSYFWNQKKECGSKVKDYDDMIFLDQLRRR